MVCSAFGLNFSAAAQSFDASGYATLGYSDVRAANLTNGAVTGRVGVRFRVYLGIEGEFNFGLNDNRFIFSPPCPGPECSLGPDILVTSKLRDAEAVYAVGFLPLRRTPICSSVGATGPPIIQTIPCLTSPKRASILVQVAITSSMAQTAFASITPASMISIRIMRWRAKRWVVVRMSGRRLTSEILEISIEYEEPRIGSI